MPAIRSRPLAALARRPVLLFYIILSSASPASAWASEAAPADTASSNANTNASALQEIVVTATRREESISKVPISITAMSQDMLDQKGIRDISELVRFTPGVSLDTSGTNQISIRGISSSAGAGTTGI